MKDRILSIETLNDAPEHDVLVVVPTYKERENVGILMDAVAANGSDMLFVDDASPDGTQDVIREKAGGLPVRVFLMRRAGKCGLGTAYADAYRWILRERPEYRIVVQMDADLSHEPGKIRPLAESALEHGVAIGSRYVPGGLMPGWPLHRRLLSRFANLYVETVVGVRFGQSVPRDSTAGFVAWRRDALGKVFSAPVMSNGYAFQIETKFRAGRAGYRPSELPITFPDRSRGVSKIDRSIVFEALFLPWRLRGEPTGARPSCPSCGEEAAFLVTKGDHETWRCPACGMIFVWPGLERPPEEIYREDYFSGATEGFGYVDYDEDKAALEGLLSRILTRLEDLLGGKGRLLDVGAATGHFVGLARERGWDARGIDVSAHSARVAASKGLPVEAKTLDSLDDEAKGFDVITMWDVLEHVPDPDRALRQCHARLREGGLLALMTPDAGSAWARLWGKRWHAIVPPEHLHLYTEKALRKGLEEAGFEVVDLGRPVKSFTLPYILSTAARWVGAKRPEGLTRALGASSVGRLPLPVPIRDNLFVIAKRR